MNEMSQDSVYVNMMVDALRRKEKILTGLYDLTKEQEILLKGEEVDADAFDHTLDEKSAGIDELNELDDGFDALFKMVEKEITTNREAYKEAIQEMQELIRRVTDIGIKLQALEYQNNERAQLYFSNQRKKIRDFHVNNRTATTYYNNMTNAHRPEQSYFFNKKK